MVSILKFMTVLIKQIINRGGKMIKFPNLINWDIRQVGIREGEEINCPLANRGVSLCVHIYMYCYSWIARKPAWISPPFCAEGMTELLTQVKDGGSGWSPSTYGITGRRVWVRKAYPNPACMEKRFAWSQKLTRTIVYTLKAAHVKQNSSLFFFYSWFLNNV